MAKKRFPFTGKPRRFIGDLAEPIIDPLLARSGPLMRRPPQSEKEAARTVRDSERRILRRRLAKLGKLLALYNIDPKSPHRWIALSLRLAIDFVPGMRAYYFDPRTRRGRPIKWQGRREVELVESVNRIKAERGRSVADAIRVLQTREPELWGSAERTDVKKKTASLQARYYEAVRHLRLDDTDTLDLSKK